MIGAIIGVPVAAFAYCFLKARRRGAAVRLQDVAGRARVRRRPAWWPVPLLALSGLLVALRSGTCPEPAGHKPAEGFKAGGPVPPIELPGIILAAFATLSLGVVLGPEAPLIAIGSGLGVLAVHLIKRDAPPMASVVIGVAGSFAAISTLLGSPLVGAFLLMEAGGLGGAMMGVVLVPGLLAAGVGSLIFVGLDDWTGIRDVLPRGPGHPAGRTPDRRRVPLGDRDRPPGRGRSARASAARARAPADRRAPQAHPHPGRGRAIGVLVLVFVEATDKRRASCSSPVRTSSRR